MFEMTQFDKDHMYGIMTDEIAYNWSNAITLRYLNKIFGKLDIPTQARLYRLFPEQIEAVLEYWGWPKDEIKKRTEEYRMRNIREALNMASDMFPSLDIEAIG